MHVYHSVTFCHVAAKNIHFHATYQTWQCVNVTVQATSREWKSNAQQSIFWQNFEMFRKMMKHWIESPLQIISCENWCRGFEQKCSLPAYLLSHLIYHSTCNTIILCSQIIWIQNFTHGLPDPGTSRSPKRTICICPSTINQTTLQIRATYFSISLDCCSSCFVLCPILKNLNMQHIGKSLFDR